MIAWRFGLAVGAAGLVLLGADAGGVEPADRVLDLMAGLDFIAGISVAAAAIWWTLVKVGVVGRRRRAEEPAYAEADQLMHRLAFANATLEAYALVPSPTDRNARRTIRVARVSSDMMGQFALRLPSWVDVASMVCGQWRSRSWVAP